MKMTKFILTALIVSFGSVLLGQEMHQDAKSKLIQYRKPSSLFNGQNLKGWYTYVQKEVKI